MDAARRAFGFLKAHPRVVRRDAARGARGLLRLRRLGDARLLQGRRRRPAQRRTPCSSRSPASSLAAYYLLFVSAGCASSPTGSSTSRIPRRCAPRWSRCSRSTCRAASGRRRRASSPRAAPGSRTRALVTVSILVEAGISAVAGVIVFVVSLAWVEGVDAPIAPLVVFAVVVTVLLHPRVFCPLASRVLRELGHGRCRRFAPRRWRSSSSSTAATWVIGGIALWFLLRSVGAHPDVSSIVFLGGAAAVGAIVAVLSVFAPSGLGPREASMYGLMLAVAPAGRGARRDGAEPRRDHARRGAAARRRRRRAPARRGRGARAGRAGRDRL